MSLNLGDERDVRTDVFDAGEAERRDTRRDGAYTSPRRCFYCEARFTGRNDFWNHVYGKHWKEPLQHKRGVGQA